jgi:general stress protein YciG
MNIRQEGGKRAAKKVKETYGEDFFKKIGAKGGAKSRGGGFTGDPQRASEAGKAGVKKRWAKYYAEKEGN